MAWCIARAVVAEVHPLGLVEPLLRLVPAAEVHRSSAALTYMKWPNVPRMPRRAAIRSPVSIASSASA